MSTDREQIEHAVLGVVHHIDHKRWRELRACFADQVTTDYTSLFGGSPATQPANALIALWRETLSAVTTQHLLGPVALTLTGDRAEASCHVRAMHHAPAARSGSDWEVLGHYHFELARSGDTFNITHLTLSTFHQLGNRNLLQEAR